jgi:anti-sigma B factor antagonist
VHEARQFQVEVLRPTRKLAVVEVEGELDIYTAPKLSRAFGEVIETGAQGFVVDLSAVPFIDSTGLSVLVSALRHLQPQGRSLSIVCNRANIRRSFKSAGLLGLFDVYDSREQALAAAGEPRAAG